MQYLNRKQFDYSTRYSRIGLGKDDIDQLVGVVRRIQEKEMAVSGKVGDVTFTFWFCPTSKPGTVLRVCAMGLLAEQIKNIKVGDVVNLSGSIVPAQFPWVKASQVEIKESARPAQEEQEQPEIQPFTVGE